MKINSNNNLVTSNKRGYIKTIDQKFTCPFCKQSTPLIENIFIDSKTKAPYISIKCKCNKKNENSVFSISNYFTSPSHEAFCFKHSDTEAEIYCKKCSLYMCEVCSGFHSTFKKDHNKSIVYSKLSPENYIPTTKEEKQEIDTSLLNLWNKTSLSLKYKYFLDYEKYSQKLISDYNEYILGEIKMINEMIFNLNQLKKDIQSKSELVVKNANSIIELVRSIYNDFYDPDNNINKDVNIEKIINMQRISSAENILLIPDNELLGKVCNVFNKIITILFKHNYDMVNKVFVNVDKKTETELISTGLEGGENTQMGGTNDKMTLTLDELTYLDNKIKMGSKKKNQEDKLRDGASVTEINNYINNNFIAVSPSNSSGLLFDDNFDNNMGIFGGGPFTPGIMRDDSDFMRQDFDKSKLGEGNLSIMSNTPKGNITTDGRLMLPYFTQKDSIYTLTEHIKPLTCVIQLIYNKNKDINSQIVSASGDNYIIFWNSSNYQAISKMSTKKGNMILVYELKDGALAVTFDINIINIYTLPAQICTSVLIGHGNQITSLIQIVPKVLISSSKDRSIKFWDLEKSECSKSLFEHFEGVNYLLLLEGEKYASCSDDGKIIIWNNQVKLLELIGQSGKIYTMCKVDSTTIASGGDDFDIKLWNYQTGECVGSLMGHTGIINQIINVSLTETDPIIISVSTDKRIIVWDVTRRNYHKEIQNAHAQQITTIMLTKDGKIFTGGNDGLIKIWK